LVIQINSNGEKELDLSYINENIKNLEILLKKHDIFQKNEFKAWYNDFKKIYGEEQTNLHLYSVFALIYLIGYIFISKYILNNKEIRFYYENSLKILKEIEKEIKSNFANLNLFEINYFDPIFSLSETENLDKFKSLIWNVSNFDFKINISPEYYFDYLIQKLISPITRHKSGEYYTPPFLVKIMVRNSYVFGETVLDPCCGSGNFLIEVVKIILSQKKSKQIKIAALNKIYGFDINPISIYISKINLFYLIKDISSEFSLNLCVFDSLFQAEHHFSKKFDLVIGNPPWYTYRDIESVDYQEKIKYLAEQLKIKPQPKNLLNLEISTLFFVKAKNTLLKVGAKIFFVITKGVITGSHASRFRNFDGFSNLKIWTFDKRIENIFKIDFICLYGQKSTKKLKDSNREIESYHYILKNNTENIEYFNEFELKLGSVDFLKPYSIEEKAGKTYTKKLVTKESLKNLLPIKESYYKKLFHKGADLNPRNLIFIRYKNWKDSLVQINPDNRIFKRAKSPWNKKEFKNELIEKKFIFKVIKSTELVKFYIYNSYDVFLPLKKRDLSFDYDNLDENAKLFYDKINDLYKKHKKATTKHRSLMENLNRWSKLINERQLSKIKVVYNNSGSILQCAVVQGDYLVTGDLSFFATKNLDEAFYLSAILNSNLITKQVKIMKSSRHIFKLPFDISIKKYDFDNLHHKKLVELGKKGQEMARSYFNSFSCRHNNISKIKIQHMLSEKLKPILIQIDKILMNQFHPK
jgi:hypothetical protein